MLRTIGRECLANVVQTRLRPRKPDAPTQSKVSAFRSPTPLLADKELLDAWAADMGIPKNNLREAIRFQGVKIRTNTLHLRSGVLCVGI